MMGEERGRLGVKPDNTTTLDSDGIYALAWGEPFILVQLLLTGVCVGLDQILK
jgi:hypothetical protein